MSLVNIIPLGCLNTIKKPITAGNNSIKYIQIKTKDEFQIEEIYKPDKDSEVESQSGSIFQQNWSVVISKCYIYSYF